MKLGLIIVDLVVEQGGNCEFCQFGKVVDIDGVMIMGYLNVFGCLVFDVLNMYVKNFLNFLILMIDKEMFEFKIDWEDEII